MEPFSGFWEATERLNEKDSTRVIAALSLQDNGQYNLVQPGPQGEVIISSGGWSISHANVVWHGKTFDFQGEFVLDDGISKFHANYDDGILRLALEKQVLKFRARYSTGQLIACLESGDRQKRIMATQRLFAMGPAAVPMLERAGAKQMTPTGSFFWRRLDAVYTLLAGLQPQVEGAGTGYNSDSFGLLLEKESATEAVVDEMGQRYGFSRTFKDVKNWWKVHPHPVFPTCYVQLDQGKDLKSVMTEVLANETCVRSVCVNYWW